MPMHQASRLPARALAAAAAAFFMGGCLLPQPDTPPIPPASVKLPGGPNARPGGAGATAPVAAPATELPMAATTAAPTADAAPTVGGPTAGAIARSATRLAGSVAGATATRVSAVPQAKDQAGALVAPGADGSFALDLAPGVYTLEITTAAGVVIATPTVEVEDGGPVEVTITVAADGKSATVTKK